MKLPKHIKKVVKSNLKANRIIDQLPTGEEILYVKERDYRGIQTERTPDSIDISVVLAFQSYNAYLGEFVDTTEDRLGIKMRVTKDLFLDNHKDIFLHQFEEMGEALYKAIFEHSESKKWKEEVV